MEHLQGGLPWNLGGENGPGELHALGLLLGLERGDEERLFCLVEVVGFTLVSDLGHDLVLGKLFRLVLLEDKVGFEASLLACLADRLNQFDGSFEGLVETRDEALARSEELGREQFHGLLFGEVASGDVLRDAELALCFVALVGCVRLLEDGGPALGAVALEIGEGAVDGLVVMGAGLCHDILREGLDLAHEGFPVELTLFHLAELGFPVPGHGRGGEGLDIHFLKELDEAKALPGDVEVAAVPREVFLSEESLDGGRTGGGGAETALGHGFPEILVLDEFASALHGREESGLGEASGRVGFFFLELDFPGFGILTFVDGDEFVLAGGDSDAPSIDGEPAGIGEDLTVGLKCIGGTFYRFRGAGDDEGARLRMIDGGEAPGDLEFGVREEDRNKAFYDHVVEFLLGVIDLDDTTGRNDGEVVGHLGVVEDAFLKLDAIVLEGVRSPSGDGMV